MFETLNREILDTKDKISSLENLKLQLSLKLTECASVISLKDDDLRLSNEKISIFERKVFKMEKDLSTLKGKEKVVETSVGISPSNQLKNELNARVEELLLEKTQS